MPRMFSTVSRRAPFGPPACSLWVDGKRISTGKCDALSRAFDAQVGLSQWREQKGWPGLTILLVDGRGTTLRSYPETSTIMGAYAHGLDVLGVDAGFARALAGRGVQVDERSVDRPWPKWAKNLLWAFGIGAVGYGGWRIWR